MLKGTESSKVFCATAFLQAQNTKFFNLICWAFHSYLTFGKLNAKCSRNPKDIILYLISFFYVSFSFDVLHCLLGFFRTCWSNYLCLLFASILYDSLLFSLLILSSVYTCCFWDAYFKTFYCILVIDLT